MKLSPAHTDNGLNQHSLHVGSGGSTFGEFVVKELGYKLIMDVLDYDEVLRAG